MVKRLSSTDQNNSPLKNIPAPVAANDAANKSYVDGAPKIAVQATPPANTTELWLDTSDNSATSYGNAQTVNGYTANTTPAPNTIPVLGADGKMPTAAFQGVKTYTTATTSTNVATTDTSYYPVATITIPAADVPTGHNYYVFVSGTTSYNHGGTTGGAQVYARINVNNTTYTKASITGVAAGQYFVGPLSASFTGQLIAGAINTISLEASKDFTSGASVNFGAWGSFHVMMVAV